MRKMNFPMNYGLTSNPIMKKSIIPALCSFLVMSLIMASPARANDAIKKQVLKLHPQADTNGDGVLSDAEEAALSRKALERFPQADADGDGVLSDVEKKALLQKMAAQRVSPIKRT
jgi:hypothetical protein